MYPKLREALRGAGTGHIEALPARTLTTIAGHDASSEVLIKLIQLGIVVFFGLFYVLGSKTDAGTTFSLVPFALGMYFALTLGGLAWVLRRELPDWAVYGSILIDVLLLMALIWSFHVQYGQPAAFYLKAPTLLYIFIFIALRTLRFEGRFVLATGFAAAVGWATLVGYVALSDGLSVVTHDYVRYLTSNAVLIGAEIDKIVSILVVSGVLWLALRRARNLLVRAVREQAAVEDLSRFFDEPVAQRIRRSGLQPRAGTRRRAAILNVDLRNFSALSGEMDPAEVVAVLTAYQRRVVPLIQRHHGIIDKYLGDGIMATFGALKANGSYAADALRAIDAIAHDAASWSADPLLARLDPRGVNAAAASGPIIAGAVGGGRRLEFTVIGAPVNLAAKLEKHNKVLHSRALATWELYEIALAQGYEPSRQIIKIESVLDASGRPCELAMLHACGVATV
jgi:adenylate cyclase